MMQRCMILCAPTGADISTKKLNWLSVIFVRESVDGRLFVFEGGAWTCWTIIDEGEQFMSTSNTRKPTHPGVILDEHYIKPLDLNLDELAQRLGMARNTLFKIRTGKASVTPSLALSLAEAFDTTPQLWLNLQQKYDLWVEQNAKPHHRVMQIIHGGKFYAHPQNIALRKNYNLKKSAA
jgi:addiction module HigA family antidote